MTTESNELNLLLEEKDQLISALTERLEMAAEQLDRLHRTGADRPAGGGNNSGSASAVPPEMLEDQRQMMENIQQMFGQWDEMPATASLGRIETQISEVRDLILKLSQEGVSLQNSGSTGTGASHFSSSDELNHLDLPPEIKGESSESSKPDAEATDQAVSNWDAIKAGILGEEVPQPSIDSAAPSGHEQETSQTSEANASQPVVSIPVEPDVPEAEAPPEVDLDTASRAELCEAVIKRDDYITWLLSQLFDQKHPDFDWDNLPTVPNELQHRLHHLETQLEAKLRMAEVSCAMERARIGRDEARIKQIEQQAQRLLKRLGVNEDEINMQAEPVQPAQPAATEDQNASGKWRRLLGLGDNEN